MPSITSSVPFVSLPFSLFSLLLLLFPIVFCFPPNFETVCPTLSSGVELRCARACCRSLEGENQGYFCCEPDNVNVVESSGQIADFGQHKREERFAAVYAPGGGFQVDWSLFIIGLILSILLSILLSFFCCLLCNGCWLHRRRNPHMYENVGERGEDGFYHICCGFGIPTGTVVFSTHPPQFSDGVYAPPSSLSSASRSRVRFNEGAAPKGVLKNGDFQQQYPTPPMGNGGGYYGH
ncbi:hypothetical protein niasHT_022076 [Heterodera trifolii]|uniref:Uncharacterized protein n=1 Tax=Heterodera trifolii TaxID=157864 RepID=A0ABD2JJI3_9BILA